MSMTDPIADMLTRIRNGLRAGHREVSIPASGVKQEIARILADEGYVEHYERVDEGPQGTIRVRLKYTAPGAGAIAGLQRISRPGRRVYCGKNEIPKILGGMGVAILSTPQGIQSGAACQKLGIGGEVLCAVW